MTMMKINDLASVVLSNYSGPIKSSFDSMSVSNYSVLEDRIRVGDTNAGIVYYVDNIPSDLVNKVYRLSAEGTLIPLPIAVGETELNVDKLVKDNNTKSVEVPIKGIDLYNILKKSSLAAGKESTFFNRFQFVVYDNGSMAVFGLDSKIVYISHFGDTKGSTSTIVQVGIEFDKFMFRNLEKYLNSFKSLMCSLVVTSEGVAFCFDRFKFYVKIASCAFAFAPKPWIEQSQWICCDWANVSRVLEQADVMRKNKSVRYEKFELFENKVKVSLLETTGVNVEYEITAKINKVESVQFDYLAAKDFILVAGIKCEAVEPEENIGVLLRVNADLLRMAFKMFGGNFRIYFYQKQFAIIEQIPELNSNMVWC